MAWPGYVVHFEDGSKSAFTSSDDPNDYIIGWQALPAGKKITRINFSPPFQGAEGDFDVVLSTNYEYWLYREDIETMVFGWHIHTDDGSIPDAWPELVYDRRNGFARVDREQQRIPDAAVVRGLAQV